MLLFLQQSSLIDVWRPKYAPKLFGMNSMISLETIWDDYQITVRSISLKWFRWSCWVRVDNFLIILGKIGRCCKRQIEKADQLINSLKILK